MTEITNEPTDLIKIELKNAIDIFTEKNGLDPYIAPLKEIVDSYHGDATTEKGRKEIKSFCYKLARSKSYIDGIGKDLVAEMKEKPKLIDAERKRVRELIEGWSEQCRKPLSEFEHREQERINDINNRIALIKTSTDKMEVITEHDVLDNLFKNKKNLEDFDPMEFTHDYDVALFKFEEKYKERKIAIDEHLKALKERMEADAKAEQERLERVAAEAKGREQQALLRAQEAEIRAKEQAEALAKEREENKIKAAEQLKIKQEQDALIAEQRENQEAYNAKLQEERETKERSKQKEHRDKILLQILEDIKNFIDEDSAKIVTKAIIKNEIRNIKIVF